MNSNELTGAAPGGVVAAVMNAVDCLFSLPQKHLNEPQICKCAAQTHDTVRPLDLHLHHKVSGNDTRIPALSFDTNMHE